MKPLTLEIAGLNSFRTRQVIEFGALLEDGLFGIFGPTGSGKSTILDAITLALYGRVKRAQGGKGGIINVREKTCSVRFTFEIDGDGERRRYSVERVLARASGRADGVQTKRARLVQHDGALEVPIAEKQSEIDERMLELLGIEYQEFLRAVVLPQGSFAEFLGLTPKDRAGVLQRLFGLHELGHRLNARLRSSAEALRTTRAGIEGRLAELRSFDDDAVAASAARRDEATLAEHAARTAFEEASATLRAAEELHSLLEELRILEARDASRDERERELAGARLRLELAARASVVVGSLDALDRAEARLAESSRRREESIAARDAAEAGLATACASFERIEATYAAEHARLTDELVRLEAVLREEEALEGDRATLTALGRARDDAHARETARRSEVESVRGEIDALRATLADVEAQAKNLAVSREEHDRMMELRLRAGKLTSQREELERTAGRIRETQEAIESLTREHGVAIDEHGRASSELLAMRATLPVERSRIESLTARREELLERYRAIESTLTFVEHLENERRTCDDECMKAREALVAQRAEWTRVTEHWSALDDRRKELQIDREDVVRALEEIERRNALALLAEALRDGEPCPLCGSLEHDGGAVHASEGRADVHEHRARIAAIDGELARMTEAITVCSQTMASITTRQNTITETLEATTAKSLQIRLQIDERIAAVGEERPLASPDDIRRYLAEITEAGVQIKEAIATASARAEEIERSIEKASARCEELASRCASTAASLESRRGHVLDLRNEASVLESLVASGSAQLATDANGLDIGAIEEAARDLQEKARAVEHLQNAAEHQRRKLELLTGSLASAERDCDVAARERVEADTKYAHVAASIASRDEALALRLSALRRDGERELEPAALVDARRVERDRLVDARRAAEGAFRDAESTAKVTGGAVAHAHEACARDVADRDACRNECDAALAAAGFTSGDEARAAALDATLKDELTRRCREIEDELRTLSARIDEVRRRVDGRTLAESDLARIREEHATALATQDAAIGESAAARNDAERIRERNAEYHRFSDENAGTLERERTLEQLGRFLHADAFINFLADERLADVCHRASRLLEDLTGGRYAILSRPNDGFIVRDMANGGVERAPSSLSGGETFVVSLALSLALSDTIQLGRAPLEFFFLDEGFGTLDAELLDTVVDTLERLRSRRRTIGLITHVGVLRERVPRRLVVSPADDAGGSVIRYEVA
jgi:exonuclease SbcC